MARHKSIWLLAGAVILLSAAGCYPPAHTPGTGAAAPAATPSVTASSPAAASTPEPVTQMPPVTTATRAFTPATIAPAAPVGTGEATVANGVLIPTPFDPALQQTVKRAQEDLARRLGIETDQIEVVEVQSVVWPDGGLGCPQPGMAYTQVQVDGLLIRLQAGGQVYDYHSGGVRSPFLCKNGQ
jgi:hypothetical protein